MRELRLQNLDRLDFGRLEVAVRRMAKPRIDRAYRALQTTLREEES